MEVMEDATHVLETQQCYRLQVSSTTVSVHDEETHIIRVRRISQLMT